MLLALVVFLAPSDALAWGPAAHLETGRAVLAQASLLSEFVRVLLQSRPWDFLYGNLSPDIVLVKNAVPAYRNGHRWQVGFRMLSESQDPSTCAFALGYLCHLASDTVAHNRFVPHMIKTWPKKLGSKHLYWEHRFDERVIHDEPELDILIHSILKQSFPVNDRFFRRLVPMSLLPHRVSRSLFTKGVRIQSLPSIRDQVEKRALRSRFKLPDSEYEIWKSRSHHAVFDLLYNLENADITGIDPMGRDAILQARYRPKSSSLG